MMHYPIITALAASAFGLIYIILTLRVGLYRGSSGIFLGDGGDAALLRRIRVHGNFAEYVPLSLILLALIEGTGAPSYIVLGIAASFVFVRLVHAVGLSIDGGPSTLRTIGGLGTIMVLLGASVWLGVMTAQTLMP